MDTQSFVRSKTFMGVMIALVFIAAVVGSFLGGMAVGFHKARFSYDWGERYEKQFMGYGRGDEGRGKEGRHASMMGRGMAGRLGEGRDFRNGHGAAGEILSIGDDGHTFTIKNPDNNESTVRVQDATLIRSGRDTVQLGDIKVGDRVVVFGKPGDEGVVLADFMRVFRNDE